MMNPNWLYLPVLLQILLTLTVYSALIFAKIKAIRAGEVNNARRALHDDAWPEYVQKINNNIRNQFEVPVLFYVLVIALIELNAVGLLALLAAWAFALSRLLHAWIHTGANVVLLRRNIFLIGVLAIFVLTALLLYEVVVRL
tara:strand:- start:1104 stop:1529 length:426 start_codon:yes stop_codon:yes gene_type:complete